MKIKVTVKTQERDRGWKAFKAAMKAVHGSHTSIGVHESAGSYPGTDAPSVAEVALWNEFGTEHAPERSYMRKAYKDNEKLINQWKAELMKQVQDGELSVSAALDALGFRFQTLVQNAIQSNPPPPNAESTLEAKRRAGVGTKTLQWSRLLLRSITHKVDLAKGGGK